MDIRKLVNEAAHQQSRSNHSHAPEHSNHRSTSRKDHSEHDRGSDARQWENGAREHPNAGYSHSSHHHSLPPFSSILPDHHQGAYTTSPQQINHPHQHPRHVNQPYGHHQPPPSPQYLTNGQQPFVHRPDAGRSSHSSSSSSSTISSTFSSYSSLSSGLTTSAERLQTSDDEDDESEFDDDGIVPLPPYPHPSQNGTLDSSHVSQYDYQSQPPPMDGAEFVCEDCGVSYSRGPDLRRHKATVHNDKESREKLVNTWPCEICGQVLLSSHGYQGHMRRHYDERPFVCEAAYCGKAFHDSATLARHRRTHSTEHKFECDFCGRRFKRKDNLNTHRKKHQVGGETINPNLLRKPVTRLSNDSPPSGTPPQSPYGYNDPSYPGAAPPYPSANQHQDWPQQQSHAQAPPYPHSTQPAGYYNNVRPASDGRSSRVMATSVTPTPRGVKLEDDSDYDYHNASRMPSVVPAGQNERW